MTLENKIEEKNDETVQKKPFLCAQFDDGFMVVHESWIKQHIVDSSYEVYYPSKNASHLVTKHTPKDKIANWDFMTANIISTHGKIILIVLNKNNLY